MSFNLEEKKMSLAFRVEKYLNEGNGGINKLSRHTPRHRRILIAGEKL